jgi:Bacterial type II/III secretion system short domain
MRVALLALLLAALPAAEDVVVEVIEIQNRPAQDLVEALLPLVGPGGAVTALQNRLVVKASPVVLQQVRNVVAELDVAPRNLWITVRQSVAISTEAGGAALTGQVSGDPATVTVSPDGRTVTTTRSRTRVSGAFGNSSAEESGNELQRLQVLEGRPAFIRAGESVAVPGAVAAPSGTTLTTTFADADHGFWVLPRLAGRVVTLELATSREDFGPGATLAARRVETVVSGRLGEWIHVGGIGSTTREESHGGAASSARETRSDFAVDLRVDADSVP